MTSILANDQLKLMWKLSLVTVFGAAVLLLPDMLMAGYNADIAVGAFFCRMLGWFTGNTGKALASIAVTIIGIGALLGKVSWGLALIVATGIALVFGAQSLISNLTDGGLTTCNTSY